MRRWCTRCSIKSLLAMEKWLRAILTDCAKLNLNDELLIETLLYKWTSLFTDHEI